MTVPALSTQDSALRTGEWLPIAEAARLTGLSVNTWRFRAAGDLVYRGLARKQAAPGGIGRATWYVHTSADAALGDQDSAHSQGCACGLDLSHFAAHHIARGRQRLHWVERWEGLCRANQGKTKRELATWVVTEATSDKQQAGVDSASSPPSLRISVRSLQAWKTAYARHGLIGLIDYYGSTAGRVGDATPTPTRSPDAIAYFYDLYRTQAKRKVALCHDMTVEEAARLHWKWPRSYSATVKWLKDYDDVAITYLLRFGPTKWAHLYKDFVEQDYRSIGAGRQYVLDHHQLNCWVRHRGKQVRPWLSAVLDQRTRVLVGWHISAAANTDTVLAALHRAFADYGVPRKVRIDNGKDYTSKALVGLTKKQRRELRKAFGPGWRKRWEKAVPIDKVAWKGLFAELAIDVVYTQPYQPQAKNVERFFGTVDERFTKLLATYCGKSPDDRPECLAKVKADAAAVPLMEDLALEQFPRFLDWYHNDHAHSGDGMGGLSPLQAWRAAPCETRTALDAALACLVGVRGAFKVGKNGVHVQIGSRSFSYGRVELQRWKGRKVLVGLDPCLPGRAYVYDSKDRRLLATVASNDRISPDATLEDLREAVADVNRARKVERKAKASAATRMKSSARVANEAAARRTAERLRATGTDDVAACASPAASGHSAPIAVVQTGFEAASKQAQADGARRATAPPARPAFDLATINSRLGFGVGVLGDVRGEEEKNRSAASRAKIDALLTGRPEGDSDESQIEGEQGRTPRDAFSLLGKR